MNATVPGPLLGTGRRASVHAVEGGALKLYAEDEPAASAFGEAGKLAAVADAGLPVPQVHAVGRWDGRWGVLMSRCDGPSLADRMRARGADTASLLAAMAALHGRIHACRTDRLPALRARLRRRIERAARLEPGERRALIDALARLGPEQDCICHGDFHPGNILGPVGSPVVIDWMDATAGDPEADLCRSWLLLRTVSPELADAYLAACAASDTERAAILRWLPFVAAARLAEGIGAESDELARLARGHRADRRC